MDEKALEAAIKVAQAYCGPMAGDSATSSVVRAAITAYLEASGIQKDAERYRWLRDDATHAQIDAVMVYGSDELDTEIDKARK